MHAVGFPLVGFVNCKDTGVLDGFLQPWLEAGHQADMRWMETHQHLRENPKQLEPYAKSFICVALPYHTQPAKQWQQNNPISNYAWGEDYHKIIRKKLKLALTNLRQKIPHFKGRGFVDSAPVPEKVLAYLAGLGWIGKNSLLIHPKYGSYLFLAEILTNLELQTSPPMKDHCGHCRRCLDACPTTAILPEKVVNSNRCISWMTIEKKGEFNEFEAAAIEYQVFGCDICQQVCPWNKKPTPLPADSPFQLAEKWQNMRIEDFAKLDPENYETLKQKSPIKRAKYMGIKRNAKTALKNQQPKIVQKIE